VRVNLKDVSDPVAEFAEVPVGFAKITLISRGVKRAPERMPAIAGALECLARPATRGVSRRWRKGLRSFSTRMGGETERCIVAPGGGRERVPLLSAPVLLEHCA
jgi:hypothetical protein